MKLKSLLLSLKTILFLITFFFVSQSLSAQTKPASIEGYWQGKDYELYLQHGLFLLQTKEKTSLSGAYQLNKDLLTLGEGENKQVFRVIQTDHYLILMGAEIEIKLQATKTYASRNISLGMINQIEISHMQEAASSQLPDQFYN